MALSDLLTAVWFSSSLSFYTDLLSPNKAPHPNFPVVLIQIPLYFMAHKISTSDNIMYYYYYILCGGVLLC